MNSSTYGFHVDLHPTLDNIHEDALSWVNQNLQQHGIAPITELLSIHNMPWSVVAKVQHEKGVWYFKALAKHITYELGVTTTLDQLYSGRSTVIASDPTFGYLLLDDLGINLYDYEPQSECFSLWKSALADYSRMQVTIATTPNGLSNILPNRELESLATLALPIIENCIGIEPREGENEVTTEDVKWIRNYFSRWADVIAEVNVLSIPNSLHHGDLHGANIAMKERPCVFDWGDSSWSHPFVTYFISADALQSHLNIDDASKINELKESYLEPWLEYGSMSELQHTLDLVNKISPLVMLLSWAHAISNHADIRNKDWENGLVTWTNEFLRLNK